MRQTVLVIRKTIRGGTVRAFRRRLRNYEGAESEGRSNCEMPLKEDALVVDLQTIPVFTVQYQRVIRRIHERRTNEG